MSSEGDRLHAYFYYKIYVQSPGKVIGKHNERHYESDYKEGNINLPLWKVDRFWMGYW